jgi:hypothetical protein
MSDDNKGMSKLGHIYVILLMIWFMYSLIVLAPKQ